MNKFEGGFWPGYGFITLAFIIHLIFMIYMLSKAEKANIPLVAISFIELFVMVAAGGAAMVIPGLPYWTGIIICAAVVVFSIVFMMGADVAGKNAVNANSQLDIKTQLWREIIDEASKLSSRAKDSEETETAKRIYDAVRYSDTVSNEALIDEEQEILNLIRGADFSKGDEILKLIENRNIKCKTMKRNKM
ncbi:MAG: hypothetical protein PUG51_07480 [Firmicutes bacterium]|nr:hypothetical protein [Bacillota bacterium]